jgi:Uma2 family endonuclease
MVELDHDTVDEIFLNQVNYWLEHHKQQVMGTATWFVHPDDREESIGYYEALKKVKEFLEA